MAFLAAGSSPLTRGKQASRPRSTTWQRLIPAHAGKTRYSHGNDPLLGGSSPLTRGKPPGWAGGAPACGLIPAHAGKTFGGWVTGAVTWAHPRSRGENAFVVAYNKSETGSSPLTRGKRRRTRSRRSSPGLIPAHAGKTSDSGESLTSVGAHPRSRGENTS